MKTAGRLLVLFLLCGVLSACAGPQPDLPGNWPESGLAGADFSDAGVIMEMAYEVYGPENIVISHILINTGPEPVTFDDLFSLEFYHEDAWRVVPQVVETDENETYMLPGFQACKVYINLSLFPSPLPEGLYRVTRVVGGRVHSAEFKLADKRIDARIMGFGIAPLSSLSPEYDGIDAQKDGYYTIIEDGVFNHEALQFFCDRVYLSVPAKLRTVMHSPGGAVLIRDIVFAPDALGNDRFFVTLDYSRGAGEGGTGSFLKEAVYSSLSVAKWGNKNKACLSNYVSHIDDAPPGAALELLSPDTADNIDLVATIELRTEEKVADRPYMFLVFGPDSESYAVIERGGETFGYKAGGNFLMGIEPDIAGITLTVIKWLDENELALFGITADGKVVQTSYQPGTDAGSGL